MFLPLSTTCRRPNDFLGRVPTFSGKLYFVGKALGAPKKSNKSPRRMQKWQADSSVRFGSFELDFRPLPRIQ
jgi:hypothetical protein